MPRNALRAVQRRRSSTRQLCQEHVVHGTDGVVVEPLFVPKEMCTHGPSTASLQTCQHVHQVATGPSAHEVRAGGWTVCWGLIRYVHGARLHRVHMLVLFGAIHPRNSIRSNTDGHVVQWVKA